MPDAVSQNSTYALDTELYLAGGARRFIFSSAGGSCRTHYYKKLVTEYLSSPPVFGHSDGNSVI